jgi:dienelactone hydrolase
MGAATKKAATIAMILTLLSGCAAAPQLSEPSAVLEEVTYTEAMITLSTRPGVQQRILMIQPEGKSKGILILFPGGDGAGHFKEGDRGFRLSNNFLVRSSHLFALEGFTSAIIDVPSDRASGMSDGFRTSPEHLREIRAVVSFFAETYRQPVYLVGTSRGTLSAAYVATALDGESVAGVVLTGTYEQIGSLPLERIRYPLLFVHHRDDGCRITPYAGARDLFRRATASRKKDFVTVIGGNPPLSMPCEALSTHGFLGKENEVVKTITDWLSGKPIFVTIGP